MSDRATVEFLAGVPLLEGHGEADLVQLARVVRRRRVREGEILFRQGGAASPVSSVRSARSQRSAVITATNTSTLATVRSTAAAASSISTVVPSRERA